jgi:hypothetical protein
MPPALKTFYVRLEMHHFKNYAEIHARMDDAQWCRSAYLDGSLKVLPTGTYASTAYSNQDEARSSVQRAASALAPNYDEEILLIEAASVTGFNLRKPIGALRLQSLRNLPPAPLLNKVNTMPVPYGIAKALKLAPRVQGFDSMPVPTLAKAFENTTKR